MSATVQALLEPILHSPLMVEAAEKLQVHIREEAQRRNRFYEEMTEEQKLEFIEGEVILHSPARRAHLVVTDHIQRLLSTHVTLHGLGSVFGEKCLCVFPRNDYEPDVVFFGPAKAALFTADTMKFPVPDLVVEVLSDSTSRRDRGVKFEDFQAHGVSEYWIVDADEKIVEQYLLREGHYVLALKSGSGNISSAVVPGFTIPLAALFDSELNLSVLRSIMTST